MLWMCVFRYRTWAALLSVMVATRAQPVARRAMYSVSEIRSKRSFVSQKVSRQENSLSVSLYHLQHHTLVPLWMCPATRQRREVAWFQVRVALLIEGDPSAWTCMINDYLIDDRFTTGEPQACADLSLGGSIRSDITPTNDGGGLGDTGGGESAYGVDDTSTRGWNRSTTPKIDNPLTRRIGVQSCLCPTSKYES